MSPEPASPTGSSSYDDPATFEAYTRAHTANPRNPNYVMEAPAVWAELGDITGRQFLDLGCGDGRFGAELLAAGAADYLGVDGSHRMVELARTNLHRTSGRIEHAQLEYYTPVSGSADVITCRLAAHYLADLDAWLASTQRALRPGGLLLMTVVHPVLSCHDTPNDGLRQSWVVDDYFNAGPRQRPWFNGHVVWHHRTIEQYHRALLAAGLTIRALRECPPQPDRLGDHTDELERRRRVPLFLLLAATK